MEKKTHKPGDRPCRIYLPKDPLNPGEQELTLSLNDEVVTLPLGRLVSLPERFCRLLADSGRAADYEPADEAASHD